MYGPEFIGRQFEPSWACSKLVTTTCLGFVEEVKYSHTPVLLTDWSLPIRYPAIQRPWPASARGCGDPVQSDFSSVVQRALIRHKMQANGRATAMRRRFCLVLVKPSHYDDDGYVIQWFRSAIPSNSLAALYGLAARLRRAARARRRRRARHPRLRRDQHAHPARPARAHDREAGGGMVMLVGVQSNQFPRALDIARPLRARGIQVGDRRLPRLRHDQHAQRRRSPISTRAQAMGVSLFAGEAEGRLDEVLRDAHAGSAQAALQLHGRPAGHRGHADPADHGRARAGAPRAA